MSIGLRDTIQLLTRDETAKLLRISNSTLDRIKKQRKIPFYKIEGKILFNKDELFSYVENSRVEPIGLEQYGN